MENKRILVTGGAGLIGSCLCKKLLEQGNIVICVDDMSTGCRENIEQLRRDPHFVLEEQDVLEEIDMECDRIYNLACPASPAHYQNDPVRTIKTSFIGALRTLELAKKNGARILQASTSEVYGDPEVHPQPETYWGNVNPDGIRSCYDEGKRAAETLFFDYFRQYGTNIKVVRIFNTYGPNMRADDGRVISNFIVQALKGENITVYGDGSQTRSFCYVDDLTEGMIRMMESREGFHGPVNLGNPEEIKVIDLARKIIRMTGSSSEITYRPLPQDDPVQRRPLIDLAKAELGWQPSTPLEEGLAKTIEYFRNELKMGR